MSGRQYTIRSVPAHVDRALRRLAKQRGCSLNVLVLDILEEAAMAGMAPKGRHDLDEFVGTWVEDPAFDEAMKDFGRIEDDIRFQQEN